MTVAFILDIVIAALLGVTIVYCWRLNRRLAALRQGRAELAKLISSLTEATTKAEAGISQLKGSAQEAGDELRKELSSARALRDELALITESGNNLANRLEERLMNAGRTREDGSVDLQAVRAARAERRARTGADNDARPAQEAAGEEADTETARAAFLDSIKQAR